MPSQKVHETLPVIPSSLIDVLLTSNITNLGMGK